MFHHTPVMSCCLIKMNNLKSELCSGNCNKSSYLAKYMPLVTHCNAFLTTVTLLKPISYRHLLGSL